MAREERLRFLNAIGRLDLRGTSPRQSRGRSGAVADRPSPVWRRRTRRDQSLPVRSRPSRCRKTSPRFAPWRLDDGTGESEVLASKTATWDESGPGREPFERAWPHPSSWGRDRIGGAGLRDRARPQCRCPSALPPRLSPTTGGGARRTASPGSSIRPSATPADRVAGRSSLGSIDVATDGLRPRPGAGAVVVAVVVPGAFEAGAPDGTATPPTTRSVGAIARLEAAREPALTARRARAARFPGGQPRRKVIRPLPLRGDDSVGPRRAGPVVLRTVDDGVNPKARRILEILLGRSRPRHATPWRLWPRGADGGRMDRARGFLRSGLSIARPRRARCQRPRSWKPGHASLASAVILPGARAMSAFGITLHRTSYQSSNSVSSNFKQEFARESE